MMSSPAPRRDASPPRKNHKAAARAPTTKRYDNMLDVDLEGVLHAFDAVDEHHWGAIDLAQFEAVCRYAHIRFEPFPFLKRVAQQAAPVARAPVHAPAAAAVVDVDDERPRRRHRQKSVFVQELIADAGSTASGTFGAKRQCATRALSVHAERLLRQEDVLALLFPSYPPAAIGAEWRRIERRKHQSAKKVQQAVAEAADAGPEQAGAGGADASAIPADVLHLFAMADGDGDGRVSIADCRAALPETVMTPMLAELFLRHSGEMAARRAEDRGMLRGLSIHDLLERAGVPSDALPKTTPPITIRNLRYHWAAIHRQMGGCKALSAAQHVRFAAVVNALKRHGPLAVMKLPWPEDLEMPPPPFSIDWDLQRDARGRPRPAVDVAAVRLDRAQFADVFDARLNAEGWGRYVVDDGDGPQEEAAYAISAERRPLTLPRPGKCPTSLLSEPSTPKGGDDDAFDLATQATSDFSDTQRDWSHDLRQPSAAVAVAVVPVPPQTAREKAPLMSPAKPTAGARPPSAVAADRVLAGKHATYATTLREHKRLTYYDVKSATKESVIVVPQIGVPLASAPRRGRSQRRLRTAVSVIWATPPRLAPRTGDVPRPGDVPSPRHAMPAATSPTWSDESDPDFVATRCGGVSRGHVSRLQRVGPPLFSTGPSFRRSHKPVCHDAWERGCTM
jgi:hypothetical protein